MTPIVRATALRFAAVAIPVALACACGLAVMRATEIPQMLSPSPLWDLLLALGLGAGSAIAHGAALRVARDRPPRGAALVFVGLMLVLALAVAQVAYASGVAKDGVDGGFFALSVIGAEITASPGLTVGLLLGTTTGLAFPMGHDAWWRLRGQRASAGQALYLTLLVAVAFLVAAGLVGFIFLNVAKDSEAHKLLLTTFVIGGLESFVVGLPLAVLLAGASRVEDRLQGWTPPPTPVQRAD